MRQLERIVLDFGTKATLNQYYIVLSGMVLVPKVRLLPLNLTPKFLGPFRLSAGVINIMHRRKRQFRFHRIFICHHIELDSSF